MKDLLEKSLIRIFSLVMLVTFLINISIVFRGKIKAQNEFMEDSLGFIFYEIKNGNKNILEDFEKTYPKYKLVYFDDDKNILYNSKGKIDLEDISISDDKKIREIKYGIKDSINTGYYIGGDGNLIIKSQNTILDIFDGKIISIYLIAYLFIIGIIKFEADNFVNKYIEGLARFDDNYDFKKIDPRYKEISPYFKNILESNKKLKESEMAQAVRFKEIIDITENMEEGLVICDENGKIEIMNKAAQEYLDKNSDTSFIDLIDDKDYKEAIKEIQRTKKTKAMAFDVNNFHLKIFVDPIIDSYDMGYVIIIIDNSETRKAELMRREFSANVSHELKSPLTSINGYAELISTGIAKESDVRNFAEIIYKEGNRLLQIIDDIIKLSRLDENGQGIDEIEFDIREIAELCIENYRGKSDSKNIEIVNTVGSFKLKTSISLFTDLISNIYENAIKYTNKGGKIELSSIILDKKLIIFIKDNGVGISQKDLPRIFERFYMADKARKRDNKSTGLGLSIAKHIADYLGFGLEVTSKVGCGSTFRIIIDI
ncbi:MAG: PAS domain-containing sensor histidine kinase [Anaerococcus sp.]|uniref:sensor histidine kinase n=1 Tax=Anaerococcus sp. TaxID=1872515 RepID=UPI00261082D5|nr:ATP-binding protein [Anaerococcus sp.]MCI5972457.1 PAS domain-containing sensor histidine kinase [Anaerococcus sp.]MDD6918280.1 ATP-binding protein [Peptoniphilaceae bacterium]MDY2927129.1 ATP-binding protein [Anaerococcus sp.]